MQAGHCTYCATTSLHIPCDDIEEGTEMFCRFSHKKKQLLAVVVALAIPCFHTSAEAQTDQAPPPINVGAPVRKVSYQSSNARTPSWQRVNQARLVSQSGMPEEVAPGEIIHEAMPHDGVVVEGGYGHGYVSNCGPGGCGPGGCGPSGCGSSCGDACGHDYGHRLHYCAGALFENLEVSLGVAGFKGPLDFGRNGNFGFQYGVNLGLPLLPDWGIGWQIGARGVSTNYEGQQTLGPFMDEKRDQLFSTIGIFHHATDCNPWNWGIAYDQLHDDYWDEYDFAQIRAELGFVTHHCNEFGFMLATSTKTSEGTYQTLIVDQAFETKDQYAFYFRRYLCNGGEVRGWAGFTGDGDGILGGDFSIPISDRFAFETNFNYLIPDDDVSDIQAQQEEAWAIGFNFVWHTRPGAYAHRKNPYHAFFSVADNVSMLRRLVP